MTIHPSVFRSWCADPKKAFLEWPVSLTALPTIFQGLSQNDPYAQSLLQYKNFVQKAEQAQPLQEHCFSILYVYGQSVIKGFLLVTLAFDVAEIDYLCVGSEFRQQGAASLLLHALECDMRQHISEGSRIVLEVGEHNTAALALYEKWNYKKQSMRPGYYKSGEQAVCLMKHIT